MTLVGVLTCFAALSLSFTSGILRETKYKLNWMLLVIPLSVFMGVTREYASESLPDFVMAGEVYGFTSFAFFKLGGMAGRMYSLGFFGWWRARTSDQNVNAFMAAALLGWACFTPGAERQPSLYRPLHWAKEKWNCQSDSQRQSADQWQREFCAKDQVSIARVREAFDDAAGAYRRGKYQQCLEKLNKVFGITAHFENLDELHEFCIYGLNAEIQFAEFTKEAGPGGRVLHDRLVCDGPAYAGSSFYCRLSWAEKNSAHTQYNSARRQYMTGKYEQCLEALNGLDRFVANFENSRELRSFCERGKELVMRQKQLERKERALASDVPRRVIKKVD